MASTERTNFIELNYTLYISSHCPACVKVINYCKEKQIACQVIDVEDKETCKKSVFAIPALFSDQSLLAYGADIISYFEKNL